MKKKPKKQEPPRQSWQHYIDSWQQVAEKVDRKHFKQNCGVILYDFRTFEMQPLQYAQ